MPILSTRPDVLDTLILQNSDLKLITSHGRTLDLSLPRVGMDKDELPSNFASSLSMRLDEDDSMRSAPRSASPVKLTNPVGSRFTMTYEDGESLRLSVDFVVRNMLVRRCMEAMAWVLDPQQLFALKQNLIGRIADLESGFKRNAQAIWDTFQDVVLELAGQKSEGKLLGDRQQLLEAARTSNDPITRRLAAKIAPSTTANQSFTTIMPISSEAGEAVCNILFALHLVAQDCRLSSCRRNDFVRVSKLVLSLAAVTGQTDWWDYWMRIIPAISVIPQETKVDSELLNRFETPPDVLQYLSRRLITTLKPFPMISTYSTMSATEYGSEDPCSLTALVIDVYNRLGYSPSDKRPRKESVTARAATCISFMVDQGLDSSWLSTLPCGIAMPILEMIRVCQANPDKSWSKEMYDLISRDDLAAQASSNWAVGTAAASEVSTEYSWRWLTS